MSEAAAVERQAMKDKVLEAALMHAAFDGWSRRTLLHAADDAGVDRATATRLFPQGGDSLLAWLSDWADRQMIAAVSPEVLHQMPIRRRVASLVRARLEALSSHREAMRRAFVSGVLPTNMFAAGSSLWRTVDRIWQAIGLRPEADQGFSWWSRRATLATVLATTQLYWLEDMSEDGSATWAFLDRRIEDVMRFGRVTAGAGEIFDRLRSFGGRSGKASAR